MARFQNFLGMAIALGVVAAASGPVRVAAQDADGAAQVAQLKAQLTAACDDGDEDACLNLGLVDLAVGLSASCVAGMPKGCYNLGVRVATGEGLLDPDPEWATQLFARACELGLADGCNDLGDHYRRGEGVSQSNAEAAALYRRALALDPAHPRARASLHSLPAQ